jgi:diguanylate cyclase (GGDEF)-like protein
MELVLPVDSASVLGRGSCWAADGQVRAGLAVVEARSVVTFGLAGQRACSARVSSVRPEDDRCEVRSDDGRESRVADVAALDAQQGRSSGRSPRSEADAAARGPAATGSGGRDRRSALVPRRAEDRSQVRAARAALVEAQFDDLTGTYRRSKGDSELQAEIDRALRFGGLLVLAFVDVDELKAHNDREGHVGGDRLLLDVVASIRSNLRSYDPVMRFGGDEFVCALSDTDLNDARSRFEAIQAALRNAHPGGSISVGLAELRPGDTLDKLMRRGDIALREAKTRR